MIPYFNPDPNTQMPFYELGLELKHHHSQPKTHWRPGLDLAIVFGKVVFPHSSPVPSEKAWLDPTVPKAGWTSYLGSLRNREHILNKSSAFYGETRLHTRWSKESVAKYTNPFE